MQAGSDPPRIPRQNPERRCSGGRQAETPAGRNAGTPGGGGRQALQQKRRNLQIVPAETASGR